MTATGPLDECPHDSQSGDEGPVALLGRQPRRWTCDSCGEVLEDPTDVPNTARSDPAGLVALEPSRFEYCRTDYWADVQELGGQGWQLVTALVVADGFLYLLERVAEQPTTEACPQCAPSTGGRL